MFHGFYADAALELLQMLDLRVVAIHHVIRGDQNTR